jgi:type II secretory pathway component PulC
VLAGVVVAEAGHLGWVLRAIANEPVPDPVGPIKAPARSFHWWRLADAHLFGVAEKPPEHDSAHPPVPQITWSLTATMATTDPSKGYAILGVRGKPLTVYLAGAKLVEVPEGHLIQVFADHVVLDLAGQTQILSLPQKAAGIRLSQMTAAPNLTPSVVDEPGGGVRVPPSAAETMIASLNLEPSATGMTLHPARPVQRQYGLHDGDVLTFINGFNLQEPGALAKALKASPDVVNLTYTRDGVEQTVTVTVATN